PRDHKNTATHCAYREPLADPPWNHRWRADEHREQSRRPRGSTPSIPTNRRGPASRSPTTTEHPRPQPLAPRSSVARPASIDSAPHHAIGTTTRCATSSPPCSDLLRVVAY